MRKTMNIKNLLINALLLAIGALLHQITPALGLPMQPDFALAMLFIIMILNNKDYKIILISAIATGIFTAMTTKFPGGQIPNILDKFVTVNLVYILMLIINKLNLLSKLNKDKQRIVMALFIFPIGTFISGTVFLLSAQLIVGLPASFTILFLAVVLPSVAINSICGVMLIKIVSVSLERAYS